MSSPRRSLVVLFAPLGLLLAANATSQEPGNGSQLTELAKNLLVPLHTHPADPLGGAYGIWAAGPGFKASFHDGFAFHPYLGAEAPRHLPLHWRTDSVTIGGESLPLAPRAEHRSDYRVEWHTGGFAEAYDVRADGVEQTFTLRSRPSTPGALVITGRVSTPLRAEHRAARPGDLLFSDGDRPVLRYGRAIAIDASGRIDEVLTSWDGERIRLEVPAHVMSAAHYPLVVDPLTSIVVLNSGSNVLEPPAIAAEFGPVNPRIVVAWRRHATSSDVDVYALVTNSSFTSGTWLYQNLSTTSSVSAVEAAWVGGSQDWVLVTQYSATLGAGLSIYVHDTNNLTPNSGTTLYASPSPFSTYRAPALGGSVAGSVALLVFEYTDVLAGTESCRGIRIDTASLLFNPVQFSGVTGLKHPRVTPQSTGTDWVVVMLQNDLTLRAARIPATGSSLVATSVLVNGLVGSAYPGLPQFDVAGADGRYLLAYGTYSSAPSIPHRLYARRFDWPSGAPSPTTVGNRVLAETLVASGAPFSYVLGGIAHDHVTRSHWAVAYDGPGLPSVARVGFTGGTTESATIAGLADATFTQVGGRGTFPLAYPQLAAGVSIVARKLDYPSDALSALYGAACAPTTLVTTNEPYAGNEFFRVDLAGLLPGTPAVYLLGGAAASIDLGPVGMPGCWLNVALPGFGTLVAVADTAGTAGITYSLPDNPLFVGDLFSQWFHLDFAAVQPILAHRGVRHQVR